MTILITGVPGNVGTEVVKQLIGKAPMRVAARHPDKAKQELKDIAGEIEFVHFDFLDSSTFALSFAGISQLFLVRPPALSDVENEIAPAIHAAIVAGVEHIVFLSLQGVEHNTQTPHYKIEQLLRASSVTWTFIRAGFFMQNLNTTHLAEIRDQRLIDVPVGRSKTSFIDVRDIGAVAAQACLDPSYVNKAFTITGSVALDYYEVAATLSKATGSQIRYRNSSLVGFVLRHLAAGTSLNYTLVMAMLYTITRQGNASEVTQEVQRLLGRAPISLAQYAQDYKASWV